VSARGRISHRESELWNGMPRRTASFRANMTMIHDRVLCGLRQGQIARLNEGAMAVDGCLYYRTSFGARRNARRHGRELCLGKPWHSRAGEGANVVMFSRKSASIDAAAKEVRGVAVNWSQVLGLSVHSTIPSDLERVVTFDGADILFNYHTCTPCIGCA
jgi:hypothetical protein